MQKKKLIQRFTETLKLILSKKKINQQHLRTRKHILQKKTLRKENKTLEFVTIN